MTDTRFWERMDKAVSNVQTWPDWKKGSTSNSRVEQQPQQQIEVKAQTQNPNR